MGGQNILIQAYLNVHGQTGLPVTKQKQIEDFIRRNKIDILHCQEINIDEETFSQCNFITSNYNILQNNALKPPTRGRDSLGFLSPRDVPRAVVSAVNRLEGHGIMN